MEVLKVRTSEGAGAQAAEQVHLPPYLRVRRGARTTEQQPSRTAQKGVGNMGSGCAKRNGAPGRHGEPDDEVVDTCAKTGGRLREAASRASEGSTAPQSLTANSKDAEEEPKVPDDEAVRRERDGGHQPYAAASDAHEGGASPEQRPDRRATIRQAAKPSRTAER